MKATRAILPLAASLLALAGCGFHPLYAPAGTTNAALKSVYVDIIPNRPGQLLRQSLQERLDGNGGGTKHYELSVFYLVSAEGLGVQSDNSSNRTRYIGNAAWTLKMPGVAGAKITSGSARAVDGANVIDAQFFYSDLASDAINKRIGDALADQITQALAIYFRTHPEKA